MTDATDLSAGCAARSAGSRRMRWRGWSPDPASSSATSASTSAAEIIRDRRRLRRRPRTTSAGRGLGAAAVRRGTTGSPAQGRRGQRSGGAAAHRLGPAGPQPRADLDPDRRSARDDAAVGLGAVLRRGLSAGGRCRPGGPAAGLTQVPSAASAARSRGSSPAGSAALDPDRIAADPARGLQRGPSPSARPPTALSRLSLRATSVRARPWPGRPGRRGCPPASSGMVKYPCTRLCCGT